MAVSGKKVLALDVGRRRIGLALSDPSGMFAFPRDILPNDNHFFDKLSRLIEEEGIGAVVVGLPVLLSGKEGLQAEETRRFVEELKERVALPVHIQDERLSTTEAERRMREADLSPERRKKNRDAIAAALILESYLHQSRRKQEE